jgi:hypothetical protein
MRRSRRRCAVLRCRHYHFDGIDTVNAAAPWSEASGEECGVFLFLRGAEMEPERVRAAWPAARFVARGRLEPRPMGAVVAPSGAEYETWGIIVELPEELVVGETHGAVSDDGRACTVIAPDPDDTDAAAVLAAARYWELPPAYVRRLARAANAPVEDYFYG